jgi:hypothetical protein
MNDLSGPNAEGKQTKPGRRKRPLPPLYGSLWLPIDEALRLVKARVGNDSLAAFDFRQATMDERVHAMRRYLSDGQEKAREFVPGEHWAEPPLGANLYRYPPDLRSIRGWVYSVWKPDLDRELLGVTPQAEDDGALPRDKPGPKPQKNWKLCVAAELLCALKEGEGKRTNVELAEFCQNETGYLPPVDEVGRLVNKIRHLL